MARRILMLTTGEGTVGAITSIKKIYNSLNKDKYEIVIGVDSKGNNSKKLQEEGYIFHILNLEFGIRLFAFLSHARSIRSLAQLILSYFRDLKKLNSFASKYKIDIIHTHYQHHHLLSIFTFKSAMKIWHIRAFINKKSLFGFSYFGFNSLMFLVPDHIIAISSSLKKSFWKINQKKVKVIYNGINTDDLKENDFEDFFKRIGGGRNSYIIGTVGRYNKVKGFHNFVEMAHLVSKELDNLLFVIIGPYNEPREKDYVDTIRKMISEFGLEEKVLLLGGFNSARNFMGALDILVHPNTQHEGFGNVILEAQSIGIPVITTDCGGPTDIVRDNSSGYIVGRNAPKEMANKLKLLLTDQELYDRMSINAKDPDFMDKFSIENSIKQIKKLYSS